MTIQLFAFAFLSPPIVLGLLLFSIIFAGYAQYRVSSAYGKNVRIPSRGRITGREAAEAVMARAGIRDVEIVQTPGHLTDHYDPTHKRLVLSTENYQGTSLAALGVAAHEAGHAIQHKVGYSMLQTRMALVPITQITSRILPFVIVGAFFFRGFGGIMLDVGIVCYAVLTLFHLVTLPVEFDASRRAKAELAGLGIIAPEEKKGVSETLNAAALTYVAAFLSSLINLLWLVSARRN
ncbi:Zn-dependent membrane protease YugP [Ereboglobus sp. PH5-5]|uniref:zinc metallopeptidase n=1 Tax=Ereboglobus sp. PH5-5 TaxID=2940529 RepID=UPI0024070648|nr:zinc metallopeptidase [Ereboglobus sp. PH5-5]MDF9831818.1 Zn-dependent membrane protease YugP [Ereboglobus sp. PH5-5]